MHQVSLVFLSAFFHLQTAICFLVLPLVEFPVADGESVPKTCHAAAFIISHWKLLSGDKTRALRQQWHCWPVWRHTDSISEIPCVSAVTRLVRIHVVESLVSWTSAMFLICLFVEPVWFCAAILAVELIAVLTWHVNFVVCILNNLKILLVRMIFRTELILCVPKEIHMKNRQSVSSDCEIQHVSHYSLLTKA